MSLRPTRRTAIGVVLAMLMSGLIVATPARAHSFTKTDANDTLGLLDLRSASVAHRSNVLVHSFRTFAGWAPADLGRGTSGFVIGIDKNNDATFAERCVVIFFASRLRASLTDCGRRTLGSLHVSKPNRTTVKVNIPRTQTGLSYRWAVVSIYFERRPCLNGCFDGVPNLRTFILHDLIPPKITMDTDPLRVWEASTDATFDFPFSVSDTGGSGFDRWRVQRHPIGSGSWTTVASDVEAGAKSPSIDGTDGTRFNYRVVATDKHKNQKIGPTRRVYIPRDDLALGPEGVFSVDPAPVTDADAFDGSYSQMAATDTFTYTWTPPPGCLFELIGPNNGTWAITVTPDGGSATLIDNTIPPPGDRQVIYSDDSCASSYVVEVTTGPFGLDAVLG